MTVTVRRAWEIWLVQSVHECFPPLHFEKPQALQQLWDMIQCIILCTIPTRKAWLARYRDSWSQLADKYTIPLLPLAWHTRCQRQNDRIKWIRRFCEFCRGRREDHVQRLQQEHQESSQNVRKYVSSGFSGYSSHVSSRQVENVSGGQCKVPHSDYPKNVETICERTLAKGGIEPTNKMTENNTELLATPAGCAMLRLRVEWYVFVGQLWISWPGTEHWSIHFWKGLSIE